VEVQFGLHVRLSFNRQLRNKNKFGEISCSHGSGYEDDFLLGDDHPGDGGSMHY
jgi:hypothetical protein